MKNSFFIVFTAILTCTSCTPRGFPGMDTRLVAVENNQVNLLVADNVDCYWKLHENELGPNTLEFVCEFDLTAQGGNVWGGEYTFQPPGYLGPEYSFTLQLIDEGGAPVAVSASSLITSSAPKEGDYFLIKEAETDMFEVRVSVALIEGFPADSIAVYFKNIRYHPAGHPTTTYSTGIGYTTSLVPAGE